MPKKAAAKGTAAKKPAAKKAAIRTKAKRKAADEDADGDEDNDDDEASEVDKKPAKKKKKRAAPREGSGSLLSPELQNFLGGVERMGRFQVIQSPNYRHSMWCLCPLLRISDQCVVMASFGCNACG